MSEPAEHRMKRAVKGVGLSCAVLAWLALTCVVLFIAMAYFFENPTFWIAVAALIVGVVALRRASNRPRG